MLRYTLKAFRGDVYMNLRFTVLGLNTVIISALLGLYGLITGETPLVGLSTSVGIIGATLMVYGVSRGEVESEYVIAYLKTLVESTSTVLETLDLLDSEVCGVSRNELVLVVYAKLRNACEHTISPGPGFVLTSPYYAIPVSVLPTIQPMRELSSVEIENALSSVLVSELGLCKSVKVALSVNTVEIHIAGMSELATELTKHPVDPVTIFTISTLVKLSQKRVILVEREQLPGGFRIVARLE